MPLILVQMRKRYLLCANCPKKVDDVSEPVGSQKSTGSSSQSGAVPYRYVAETSSTDALVEFGLSEVE